jgi:CO/xanthine dehydrogenase Mo-binding subunit
MDMIAERLGVDPVELRRKNLLRDGDSFATGEKLAHMQFDELLDKAAGDLQWQASDARWSSHNHIPSPTGATRRGKGLALVIKATITPSTSTAAIKLNEDGSLNVMVSSVECGQGAKTVLAQIAANAMQVPVERVAVSNPDTDVTPYDQQTSSSRTTFSMGGAVTEAAADLKQQLLNHAGILLEASAQDLVIENGRVIVRGTPNRFLPYGAVAMRSQQANLIGRGAFTTRGGLDLEIGQGIGSVHWHQGAIGCEVEVDVETGKVKVLRLSPSVFAGRVVNPRLCELQLEGCAIFGLGQALFEEMVYAERGQLLNSNLGDYNIPSFEDIAPLINASALEHPAADDLHGIGETLLPPVMAAIGNAVYNAIGVRIQDLHSHQKKYCARCIRKSRANLMCPLPLREAEGEGRSEEEQHETNRQAQRKRQRRRESGPYSPYPA